MTGLTAAAKGPWHLTCAFLRNVRSPERGLFGQGFRFALSGCLVALVYLTVTTLLHSVLGLPFQVALAIGFVVSISLHFTLQRGFVWRSNERFALPVQHQAARYLLLSSVQYGITVACTSQLPSLVGVSVEVVYVITTLAVTLFNFILFRGRVFHVGSQHAVHACADDQSVSWGRCTR